MPWLIDFYARYKSQGLETVGISMDDGDQEQVAAFVKEFNVNYTIVMGNHSVGDVYGGARFLPQTFLVDRDGRIVKSVVGIKSKQDFEESIKLLLDAK
jgi:peroxiredoxin